MWAGYKYHDTKRRKTSCPKEFIDLPDLVLLNILKYLPLESVKNVRLTCSRLHNLSYSKQIIKNQKFVIQTYNRMATVFDHFSNQNIYGINLKFSGIYDFHLSDIFRSFILINGSKINSLTFFDCILTRDVLKDIMISCCCLKELAIDSPAQIFWSEETKFASNIKIPPLKILTFHHLVDDEGSYKLIESCLDFYPEIKSLSVIIKCRFSNSTEWKFVDLIANKISTHNKYIQELQLIIPSPDENPCEHLSCLDLKLNNLKALELSWNYKSSLKDLSNLLSRCTQLESFSLLLQYQQLIPYFATLEMLNKYLKNLKTLILAGEGSLVYTNHPIRYFRTKDLLFPNLQHVELHIHISEVNYENNITVDLEFLEKCNLKHFKLYASNNISVEAVMRVISASQNTLVTLDFRKNNRIWKENLTYFESISNLRFPRLKELNINLLSPQIVVSKFLGNFEFPRLQVLDLRCEKYLVKKNEIEYIKKGCPCLKMLKIHFQNPNKTQEYIQDLKKSIESLKYVITYNTHYYHRFRRFRARHYQ